MLRLHRPARWLSALVVIIAFIITTGGENGMAASAVAAAAAAAGPPGVPPLRHAGAEEAAAPPVYKPAAGIPASASSERGSEEESEKRTQRLQRKQQQRAPDQTADKCGCEFLFDPSLLPAASPAREGYRRRVATCLARQFALVIAATTISFLALEATELTLTCWCRSAISGGGGTGVGGGGGSYHGGRNRHRRIAVVAAAAAKLASWDCFEARACANGLLNVAVLWVLETRLGCLVHWGVYAGSGMYAVACFFFCMVRQSQGLGTGIVKLDKLR
ncbi:hypothetical protein BX600DRAFT_429183 [Xylariales sp. PMI_506]|nr:hypothetical protein BX600DRAFT_429183 [Xylariales sp. PMI_506]